MTVHTGKMTLLFDQGQVCDETYPVEAPTAEDAIQRLKRIAVNGRVPMLAKNVRIVALAVKGATRQRVSYCGVGGVFAWPRDTLNLYHNHQTTGRKLRGIWRDMVQGDRSFCPQMTPLGRQALDCFNQSLRENGYVLVRPNRPVEQFHAFEPYRYSINTYRKDEKATLTKLITILGENDARIFWAERKQREAEQQARRDAINGHRRSARS